MNDDWEPEGQGEKGTSLAPVSCLYLDLVDRAKLGIQYLFFL